MDVLERVFQSPFRLQEGAQLKVDEEARAMPVEKIKASFDNGYFSLVDYEILLLLYRCFCLNRNMVERMIDVPEMYRKSSYKSNMGRLCKCGVIRRVYSSIPEKDAVNFYILTQGAKKYLERQGYTSAYASYDIRQLTIEDILRIASYHQTSFILLKESNYKLVQHCYKDYTRENRCIILDGIYTDGAGCLLAVASIRGEDIAEKADDVVNLVKGYMMQNDGYSSFKVLLVAEKLSVIRSCATELLKTGNDKYVYYTHDLLTRRTLREHVIKVVFHDNEPCYSYVSSL